MYFCNMKKKYLTLCLSILSLFAFAQCPTGQTEVTIDVSTDNWGYETYWELVPTGTNCGSTSLLFSGGNNNVGCGANNVNSGGYANNTVIFEGPWCLDDGVSYDIISRDGYGDGGASFVTNIGSWPMYNFSAGSAYETFTFSVVPPAPIDGAMLQIKTPAYILIGNISLEAKIKNLGSTTINSMDVNYRINGGPIVNQNLSGLNIYALTSFDFIHPTVWIPSATGAYNVELWISNINGQGLDAVPSNDNLTTIINVKDPIPNIISSYTSVNNTFNYEMIVNSSNQINQPRDLDFHPNGDLWIINTGTENSGGSTVKVINPAMNSQNSLWEQDGNAWHFMSLPSGIAFSDNGNFATSTSVLDANHGGNYFTGPTLWSSDPLIYAKDAGPGTNGSHLDMLHASPFSMGIASEKDNVFWVYDDYSNDIVRYDFAEDHGPGNSDHDDGELIRYQGMGLSAINHDIVNHLVLDDDKKWLYFVDGGNERVLRLDITTGTPTPAPSSFLLQETLASYQKMNGFSWEEVVTTGLIQPAGIDIIDNELVVTDYSNGDIIFYDINTVPAIEIGRIQTNEPGIMGVVIGPNGKVWYANTTLNKVVKIEPSTIIAEIEESQLVLIGNRTYPNPVLSTLNFTSTANFVSIFDINGKLVLSANNNINAIDVSLLDKGVYFIDVDGVKSKFVKN